MCIYGCKNCTRGTQPEDNIIELVSGETWGSRLPACHPEARSDMYQIDDDGSLWKEINEPQKKPTIRNPFKVYQDSQSAT